MITLIVSSFALVSRCPCCNYYGWTVPGMSRTFLAGKTGRPSSDVSTAFAGISGFCWRSVSYKVRRGGGMSRTITAEVRYRPSACHCLTSSGHPGKTLGLISDSTLQSPALISPLLGANSSSSVPHPPITTQLNPLSSLSMVVSGPQPSTGSFWSISPHVVTHPTQSRCGATGIHTR